MLSAVTWGDAVYREITQSSRFKAHRAVIRQSYKPGRHEEKFHKLAAVVDASREDVGVVDRFDGSREAAHGIPSSDKTTWLLCQGD